MLKFDSNNDVLIFTHIPKCGEISLSRFISFYKHVVYENRGEKTHSWPKARMLLRSKGSPVG
jgi:hypothetical protein